MRYLPNAERAPVEEQTLTGYLLSAEHPFGRAKARFFGQFGFRANEWKRLRTALLAHARANPVITSEATRFGIKFVIEGPLSSPNQRAAVIRAVWFVEKDQDLPRLVTAYPIEGSQP